MKRRTIIAFAFAVPSAALPLFAQVESCPVNTSAGYGIVSLECVNCTIHISDLRIEYGAEPTIRSVASGMSGEQSLASGDVLVSINGIPITTRAAAALLAAPVPGNPARFEVRRGGRLQSLDVTARCLPGGAPRNQVGRQQQGGGARGTTSGSANLGFGFKSVQMAAIVDASGTRYRFAVNPEVSQVTGGGNAARAGLRPGDILVAVDGLEVTTADGTERLSSIHINETVVFSVRRAGKLVDLVLVAR